MAALGVGPTPARILVEGIDMSFPPELTISTDCQSTHCLLVPNIDPRRARWRRGGIAQSESCPTVGV